MRFSQRIGKEPIETDLQIEGMDQTIRITLWNVIYKYIIDDPWGTPHPVFHDGCLEDIWEYYLKRASDELPDEMDLVRMLKASVLNDEWYKVYDLIEFTGTVLPRTVLKGYEVAVNKALEQERSAFRLLNYKIVPITDAAEIKEITGAVQTLGEKGPLAEVQKHLAEALKNLGELQAPDYDLAILEIVRAVKSLAEVATAGKSGSIKDLIKLLDADEMLPKKFKSAMVGLFELGDQINNKHLFRESEFNIGLEEARFMVVTGSALINYLLSMIYRLNINAEEIQPEKMKQIERKNTNLPDVRK